MFGSSFTDLSGQLSVEKWSSLFDKPGTSPLPSLPAD